MDGTGTGPKVRRPPPDAEAAAASPREGHADAPLPGEKAAIRKRSLAARDALTRPEIARKSAVISGKVAALREFVSRRTIMAYLSTGSEVETDGIISRAWGQGKQVLAPICRPREKQLIVSCITCFTDVAPGYCGIREPKPDPADPARQREIELVLVPAVAFDRHGRRIGYGGGYYDRFLAGMAENVLKIGLAFACQLVPALPHEGHDISVDLIVTEEEIIETGSHA